MKTKTKDKIMQIWLGFVLILTGFYILETFIYKVIRERFGYFYWNFANPYGWLMIGLAIVYYLILWIPTIYFYRKAKKKKKK